MMKDETLYKNMVVLLREFAQIKDDTNEMIEDVINRPMDFEKSKIPVISIAAQILMDCKYSMARKAPAGMKSAIKRLLKEVSNAREYYHDKLFGYIEGDDVYYISNSHLAIELNEAPAGLWPVKDNSMKDSIKTIFDNEEKNNYLKIEAEFDIADLKIAVAQSKTKKGLKYYVWKNGGNKAVNPQYVLDILAVLGDNVQILNDATKEFGYVWFESDKGRAILVPLRVTKKY